MILATAVALTAIGAMPTASAQSNTFTVDCNRGQKIATALELGDFRKPVVINVRGTCREFVNITRANVTLRGDPAAEIVAPDNAHDLLTVSADRVALENFTLTGGLTGLSQDHAPTFTARNVVVQDTSGIGARVRVGDARLNNCTVQRSGGVGIAVARGGSVILSNGSQVLDSAGAGISADRHGLVSLDKSTVMRSGEQGIRLNEASQASIGNVSKIVDNAGDGIEVQTGSHASINNSEIAYNQTGIVVSGPSGANIGSGNSIHHNRQYGVLAQAGAMVGIDENLIANNNLDGVFGYLGATVVMHGNEITDNGATGVSCRSNCTLQIGGLRVTRNAFHGVAIQLDSTLRLEAPTTDATGNGWVDLWCGDTESSADGLAEYFLGSTEGCTGFNN
jgi:hypothetical protein